MPSIIRILLLTVGLTQEAVSVPDGSLFTGRYDDPFLGGSVIEYKVYFYNEDGVEYMDMAFTSFDVFDPRGSPQPVPIIRRVRYTETVLYENPNHNISPAWESASDEALEARHQIFVRLSMMLIRGGHQLPDQETFLEDIVYDTANGRLIFAQAESPNVPVALSRVVSAGVLAHIVCTLFPKPHF